MWYEIVFTHRRSSDSRRTFGPEQTTRSLKIHTDTRGHIREDTAVANRPIQESG